MSTAHQVDERDAPKLREEADIEAEHQRAQESSDMFEGRRYGAR
jgi:hypothetical protein